MTLEILALIGIILFALVAFVREWLPMDAVSLTCLGLLLLFGLVTPEEAIAGFSNPAVITVMMMFVLSAGLLDSGLVTRLAYRISDWTGSGQWKAPLLLVVQQVRIARMAEALRMGHLVHDGGSHRARRDITGMAVSDRDRQCLEFTDLWRFAQKP